MTTVDTKKAFEEAEENKRNGRPVDEFAYLKYAGFMGVFGSVWSEEVDDSDGFGLKRWGEEDVKGLVRGCWTILAQQYPDQIAGLSSGSGKTLAESLSTVMS